MSAEGELTQRLVAHTCARLGRRGRTIATAIALARGQGVVRPQLVQQQLGLHEAMRRHSNWLGTTAGFCSVPVSLSGQHSTYSL
jgi:hypothetical protein